ncbi:histidine kinase [Eggerthella sinensis]|uniref:histidine kinase n=1 Tax=Eggerthella sinensis TaxID=242230 RepID=UPI0022E47E15|nr:histidine kinase [Eggerthella sinensis]
MGASNFSEQDLAGERAEYAQAVDDLKERHGFDFVSIGLTAFIGAPLKWIYSAGATGERHRRIVLSPGHGIGGITIKAGKPMMFTNIDEEIDPREYSSYPIVFAEDLHSFCALPLTREGRVVAVLLCAFRTVSDRHEAVYRQAIEDLHGELCDLTVVSDDFMNFESIAAEKRADSQTNPIFVRSELSRVIAAQEDERKRISRELHDGIAQELLTMSFVLKRLAPHVDDEARRCSPKPATTSTASSTSCTTCRWNCARRPSIIWDSSRRCARRRPCSSAPTAPRSSSRAACHANASTRRSRRRRTASAKRPSSTRASTPAPSR